MNMRLILCGLALCLSSALHAQDRSEWGTAGDWSILVDAEAGNGCLMRKDFSDGIRVEFGYLPIRNGGFFAALSADWTDLEPGATGIVKFITDQAKFAGDVEIIEADGRKGGTAFFNNPAFVVEMAARRSITVIGPKGGTFDIDLSGTSRGIDMLKECQAAQG